MPIPVALLAILGIGLAAAIIFWPQIIDWARESLLPWLENSMPFLSGLASIAFTIIDNVAVAIRKKVKDAWNKLRNYLLKQTIEIHKKSGSKFVRIVTSWVIKVLDSGKAVPTKVTAEEDLEWDELPDDVREAFIRRNTAEKIDVTKLRDEEMEKLELST